METSNIPKIRETLKETVQKLVVKNKKRLIIETQSKKLTKTIEKLVKLEEYSHLGTITAVDVGTEIEVIYHIFQKNILISLKVKVLKEEPILPSIIDLIPGAVIYEKEVHDLFGVEFKGNPDLSPLLLPDTWPKNIHPLRKEWTPEKIINEIEGDENVS
jgi:NADH:ubiquinone oxidoreductase subunit C